MPEAIEKTPTANQSVNEPVSGTYGEGAAMERLKSALPAMDPNVPMNAGPQPSGPMPGAGQLPQAGRPPQGPMGVPGVLMEGQPGVPSAPPPNAPRPNPAAQRVTLLQSLAQSQEVSETTRQWARTVLEALTSGS